MRAVEDEWSCSMLCVNDKRVARLCARELFFVLQTRRGCAVQVIIAAPEFIEQNTQLTHLLSSRCLIIKLAARKNTKKNALSASTHLAYTSRKRWWSGFNYQCGGLKIDWNCFIRRSAQKPINLNGRLTCRRVVIKSVKRSEVTCAGYWIKLTILSEKGLGVHLESTKLTSITADCYSGK